MRKNKTGKTLETVERERERALFSKIGFIHVIKYKLNKFVQKRIGYIQHNLLKLISMLNKCLFFLCILELIYTKDKYA